MSCYYLHWSDPTGYQRAQPIREPSQVTVKVSSWVWSGVEKGEEWVWMRCGREGQIEPELRTRMANTNLASKGKILLVLVEGREDQLKDPWATVWLRLRNHQEFTKKPCLGTSPDKTTSEPRASGRAGVWASWRTPGRRVSCFTLSIHCKLPIA